MLSTGNLFLMNNSDVVFMMFNCIPTFVGFIFTYTLQIFNFSLSCFFGCVDPRHLKYLMMSPNLYILFCVILCAIGLQSILCPSFRCSLITIVLITFLLDDRCFLLVVLLCLFKKIDVCLTLISVNSSNSFASRNCSHSSSVMILSIGLPHIMDYKSLQIISPHVHFLQTSAFLESQAGLKFTGNHINRCVDRFKNSLSYVKNGYPSKWCQN